MKLTQQQKISLKDSLTHIYSVLTEHMTLQYILMWWVSDCSLCLLALTFADTML